MKDYDTCADATKASSPEARPSTGGGARSFSYGLPAGAGTWAGGGPPPECHRLHQFRPATRRRMAGKDDPSRDLERPVTERVFAGRLNLARCRYADQPYERHS